METGPLQEHKIPGDALYRKPTLIGNSWLWSLYREKADFPAGEGLGPVW